MSDGVLNWGDSSVETMAQRYDATSPFITRFWRQATVFPGAPITGTGRLITPGDAIIHLKGKTSAGPVDLAVPVTFTPAGELAPRAWAEIAVTQLAEARDSKLTDLALAISQRYRVPSRLGSFLVLVLPHVNDVTTITTVTFS